MSADVATALEGTWFKDVTRILQASREAPAGHRRGPGRWSESSVARTLLIVFLRKNKDIRAGIVEQVFERGLGIAVTPGPSPSRC